MAWETSCKRWHEQTFWETSYNHEMLHKGKEEKISLVENLDKEATVDFDIQSNLR